MLFQKSQERQPEEMSSRGSTIYLKVKNWDEFQHYRKRNPPWIKLHRALLDHYKFSTLADNAKGHLMLLWLYASQNNGRIPHDGTFLERKLSCTNLNLDLFVELGFLVPHDESLERRTHV